MPKRETHTATSMVMSIYHCLDHNHSCTLFALTSFIVTGRF